jgi:tetratricopeptide (TPR) repeat protein
VAPAQFTATAVPLADARAILADIHLHSPDYQDKALAELQEVLQMQPGNAFALRGLGYYYLQRQQLDHAAEFFRQASEHESKDPRVHYYNALLLNRRSDMSNQDRMGEMKKECETAVALDPKLADAYALLAIAQLASGEREKALTTMKKAVELSPRNESYQFNLANFYVMEQKKEEAARIFRELANSHDPEIVTRANFELERLENSRPELELVRDPVPPSKGPVEQEPFRGPKPPPDESAPAPTVLPPPAPVHFLKGKLTEVDCSASPQAVLTILTGSKTRKMYVKNSESILVIGADRFSCDWKNVKVAVNFRDRSDGEGDVMSIELQ